MMSLSNNNVDRIEKFKSITTEVFALTLGLGALSLFIIPDKRAKNQSVD